MLEIYDSTVVVRKFFSVMIHGIRVSKFDIGNQAVIKKRIEIENRSLHPELEIVKARWCHDVDAAEGRERKLYFSLILHVATTEMTNDLIRKHLIEASEMKRVKRFDQAATVMQCYNC